MRGEWIEICTYFRPLSYWKCLSPCGESGLKFCDKFSYFYPRFCLSPCGESGLKSVDNVPMLLPIPSLPMRGEWIEINIDILLDEYNKGLSPCGESGLKYLLQMLSHFVRSLSPCGESGLKYAKIYGERIMYLSLPMRGEWIEMYLNVPSCPSPLESLPMRGEWIEIICNYVMYRNTLCLSPCGESGLKCQNPLLLVPSQKVSPHAGRVD